MEIPEKARADSYHLALATWHGMDFMVSCRPFKRPARPIFQMDSSPWIPWDRQDAGAIKIHMAVWWDS